MIPATQSPCVHHVHGACSAQICRWQDRKDHTICTQGGVLSRDILTPSDPKAYTAFYEPERRPL